MKVVSLDPRKTNVSLPQIVITGLDERNNINITETQFLELQCSVSNWRQDQYRVQWIQESMRKYHSSNGTLFIKSVAKDRDEGRYRCEVQHKDDETQIFQEYANVTIISKTENCCVNILKFFLSLQDLQLPQ